LWVILKRIFSIKAKIFPIYLYKSIILSEKDKKPSIFDQKDLTRLTLNDYCPQKVFIGKMTNTELMVKKITLPLEEYKKLKENVSISRYKYEEILDTIDVLTNKKVQKEIKDSKKQIRAGKYVTLKQLENDI